MIPVIHDYREAGYRLFPLHNIVQGRCGCSQPECDATGKHPIVSGWQNTSFYEDDADFERIVGSRVGTGFGVCIDDNQLVVDVDPRNGGDASLDKLQADAGLDLQSLAGFVVRTGGAGLHIYFRRPQGLSLRGSLSAYPGIDFKSSGFVVGAGSLHKSGNEYEVIKGFPQDLTDAPGELVDLLRRPEHVPSVLSGRSVKVTQSDLEEVVSCIPNDDAHYDDWLRVGMAIHHTSEGSEEGFALWLKYSAISRKHTTSVDPEWTMRKKWHSFGKTPCLTPVTFGTLIHLAEQNGYTRPQKFSHDPEAVFADLVERIEQAEEHEVSQIVKDIADANLREVPTEKLLRMIKTRFGITMRALWADVKSENEKPELDQLAYALKVIDHVGSENVKFCQSTFWRWNPCGVWMAADDRVIKQAAHEVVTKYDSVSRAMVDGVTDLCKTELFAVESPFDRADWLRVNVLNGTLRMEADGWRLDPHRREDYLTTQLPIAYDPDAKCPRFELFLQEVFQGDDDLREKALCVLEAIGYTLLTTCRLEKFFMLIGSGANGKSVLLGVIEELVGSRYVAAVQPSQFDNRFQRAHLHGRLANIVTEIAEGAEIADAQLKALVSGELTTAEHKMKPPFDFRPFATCWFGTNHMPHTRDFSDALFRRAVVLTFNRKFSGKERDPHLKDKLTSELPGILAVSLRAIAGVFKRNSFTIPASSIEAARQWRMEADQVAQFIEERCVVTASTEKVESAALYSAYQMWAETSGIRKTVNRKNFTTRLERLGMQPSRTTGGKRMISGIRLMYMEEFE